MWRKRRGGGADGERVRKKFFIAKNEKEGRGIVMNEVRIEHIFATPVTEVQQKKSVHVTIDN